VRGVAVALDNGRGEWQLGATRKIPRCERFRMNATLSPALSEIGQIALVVRDVAQATTFYRDVLGLKFLFSAGPQLAFLQAGTVRLMLTQPEGTTEAGKNSLLYFKVNDVSATHAAILARGAKNEHDPRLVAKMPDHELWMAFVRDPDGNIVGMMEEKR
jgi:predicted enzyme related to lactoylglutathione lyase